MEQIAYNFFLAAWVLSIAASAAYIAIPLWPRIVYRAAETTAGTTMTIASKSEPPSLLGPLATALSWLTLGTLTVSLIARWIAVGHPPYANMYE